MDLPALTRAVDGLAAALPGDLAVPELQALVAACRAQAERLSGVESRALGELAARTGGTVADGAGRTSSVLHWLRDTTSSTGSACGGALRAAERLRDLPVLADAVADGRLGPEQARVLLRLHGPIALPALIDSQDQLLQVAQGRDPVSLASFVRHLVATHCEPALEAEQACARDRRYLQLTDEPDGTVRGRFVLAAEDAEAVRTLLEPLARRAGAADGRSAGQRRADALVEACELALRAADLPDAGGTRPQLTYVLPAGWAAGGRSGPCCRHGGGCTGSPSAAPDVALPGPSGCSGDPEQWSWPRLDLDDPSRRCATAAWSGPQTRSRIEALLCDSRISRVLMSGGQVVSLENLTDSVTAAQRRALAARDLGCSAHGCTRSPAFCDAHHLVALADGGATDLANLVLLCRRHHVQWHDGRLRLDQLHVPWLRPASPAAAGP